MEDKLLTIGIPTFNRVDVLDKSLGHLLPQTSQFEGQIEFIISDNASTQDNQVVVDKYVQQGYNINYVRQKVNLGMDGNFAYLYEKAIGKYVWLLSDDDVLVENGLARVMSILESGNDIGSIYISNKWFEADIDLSAFDIFEPTKVTQYNNALEYVERVNYWFTFLSANIVNKNLLSGKVDSQQFIGTYLALLGWNIPAVFQGVPNVVLENTILACRGTGQGGYKFIQVFAINFNIILSKLIEAGYPRQIKSIINRHLIKYYFPSFILAKRQNNLTSSSYKSENWLKGLAGCYYKELGFYKYIVTASLLPKRIYTKLISIQK